MATEAAVSREAIRPHAVARRTGRVIHAAAAGRAINADHVVGRPQGWLFHDTANTTFAAS
jgi:hypothetical protein